jgi:hypothetical protein
MQFTYPLVQKTGHGCMNPRPHWQYRNESQIEAFIDDTALLMTMITQNPYFIIPLEQNAQTWERLLHASGGKLETPKQNFGLFNWAQDRQGCMKLLNMTAHHLHIQSSETKQITPISQLSSSTPYISM